MTLPEATHSAAPPAAQVFIAEDDPYLRELAVMLVQTEGLTCRAFGHGEEALAAFKAAEIKPLLIISDFSMGQALDGVAFLSACKEVDPKVKAFLVSGTVDETTIRVDGHPVDKFMAKPYNAVEFLRTARSLINQRADAEPPR